MSRCNSRTHGYVWLTKRLHAAFSRALVDLDRKPLTPDQRRTVDQFDDQWRSGRDLRNDEDGILDRFVQACKQHQVRIAYMRRPRPCKDLIEEEHLLSMQRYPSGRRKKPLASMYEALWHSPEYMGAYWPVFSKMADGNRINLTREERRQITADYRIEIMEQRKDELDRPRTKKRKLIPGKLLAKPSVISSIPVELLDQCRVYRIIHYRNRFRRLVNRSDNDNERDAA